MINQINKMQLIGEQQNFKRNLKELYYFHSNQTEKYWTRDSNAALKIQSLFRMFIKRKQFKKKKAAAIKIETAFRVFNARKKFKIKKMQDDNNKNFAYFARQAIMIQKIFRGFFVRKYVHDFYLRKQQLQALQKKNQQFRKELDEFGKAQALQTEEYHKQQAKQQFASLAKNLHHLSSTKNIPGVYNSPFAMQKPAVFQKTVQDHLAHQFKSSYRWRPPKKQDILKYSMRPTRKAQ